LTFDSYAPISDATFLAAVKQFEEPSDSTTWQRVDDVMAKRAGTADGHKGHAIVDSLALRSKAISAYRMYERAVVLRTNFIGSIEPQLRSKVAVWWCILFMDGFCGLNC
jgi:hypothetical protein